MTGNKYAMHDEENALENLNLFGSVIWILVYLYEITFS